LTAVLVDTELRGNYLFWGVTPSAKTAQLILPARLGNLKHGDAQQILSILLCQQYLIKNLPPLYRSLTVHNPYLRTNATFEHAISTSTSTTLLSLSRRAPQSDAQPVRRMPHDVLALELLQKPPARMRLLVRDVIQREMRERRRRVGPLPSSSSSSSVLGRGGERERRAQLCQLGGRRDRDVDRAKVVVSREHAREAHVYGALAERYGLAQREEHARVWPWPWLTGVCQWACQ